MASLMSSPEVAQGASTIAGTAFNAAGQVQAGDATIARGAAAVKVAQRKRDALEFEAAQLDVNAGQSVASAQRAAQEENLNAKLVASRALAVAAAGGGGASSSNVMQILANIAAQGQYKSMVALYQGEQNARTMRMQAQAKRYQGATGIDDANEADAEMRSAGNTQKAGAFGTILSGASKVGSLFSKYNSGNDGGFDHSTSEGYASGGTTGALTDGVWGIE